MKAADRAAGDRDEDEGIDFAGHDWATAGNKRSDRGHLQIRMDQNHADDQNRDCADLEI